MGIAWSTTRYGAGQAIEVAYAWVEGHLYRRVATMGWGARAAGYARADVESEATLAEVRWDAHTAQEEPEVWTWTVCGPPEG